MLLNAETLKFAHKKYGPINIYAPKSQVFRDTVEMLKVKNIS